MTYGDFAWNDLLRPDRRRDRRPERPRARLVEGDPVPWMEPGEDNWAWRLRKGLPHPLNRPYFTFTLRHGHRARWAIDDFMQPVIQEMRTTPVSLWAKMAEGERPGLRIADAAPAFPPKFERMLAINSPAGECEPDAVAALIDKQTEISGQNHVGVHITLRRLSRDDFDFGGNIRVIFDGLTILLGGGLGRPADSRIRDLRVVRDTQATDTTEIRIWQILEGPL